MPTYLSSVIIKSTSVSQNNIRDNNVTTTLTNEKKTQKSNIFSTPSTKKTIAEAKRLNINDLINDFANVMSSIFVQGVRNQANYKNCTLSYYYCLFFILYDLNQAVLDVLFSINLLFFYDKCDKNNEKALKNAFKSVYHQVKCKLIANIIAKVNL